MITDKLKDLYKKYEELILYVFFGGLTTVVNIVIFWLFADVMHIHYLAANFVAWAGAVLFAYFTNRRWVFKSKVSGFWRILREMFMFVAGRILSGAGDMVIMFVCVDVIHMGNLVGKIASQIFVVIFNYVFSKVIIFKNKK
ncbi:MAG: GtrA family protein [Clostridiales bacterium]|nr:GtrA family protein [Clostridiales bacterium]